MYSAVVNDGVGDFHVFTMLVILLHFEWWKVAAVRPTFGLAWPLDRTEEGRGGASYPVSLP